ncbi:MAG TPA: beta-galactosidase GalA [Phnomibacter sp.]|nr:beta-galactosidase GalA [Phnomibacter sp.]
MKKSWLCILLMCGTVVFGQQTTTKQKLDNGWKFSLGHAADPSKDFHFGEALTFSKTNYLQENTLLTVGAALRFSLPYMPAFKDSAWESIDLPHDWAMRLPVAENQIKIKGYRTISGRSPQNSVGWYRKNVLIPATAKGQKLYLQFDGIFRDARIWVNGVYIDRQESGYTSFSYDISDVVSYGKDNLICVRVDATHSELWSYEGAGIYRHVWLLQKDPVHTKQWGTQVIAKLSANYKEALVSAKAAIENTSSSAKKLTVSSAIVDADRKTVQQKNRNITIEPYAEQLVQEEFSLKSPQLWSTETPYRYTLVTTIREGEKVLDTYATPFGIRAVEWTTNDGLHLNGKRIQVQGVCNHQDHAGVGIAVADELNIWRLQQLKRMGCNALRTSHNPVAPELLDACDSMGIMVLDEVRMMSSSEEGLRQLESTIRRDRNHPSIILWSLGNEEPALQESELGTQIMSRMKAVQQQLDPSRLCTAAMNGSWGKGLSDVVDVQGCNYFVLGNMDELHSKRPHQPLLLTEEASTVSTRGIYTTTKEKDYHTAYDHDKPGWGATAEKWLRYVDARPFIAGAFVWTGLDYGGEAYQYYWPGIASNFGIMDYCGFPKDAFYYYQAAWTKEPVLHLLPHWNWRPGDTIDVHCYTNASQVELFVNGKSFGAQTVNRLDIPKWKVPYASGSIKAVANINGQLVTEEIFTSGTAKAVVLEANRAEAFADETIIVNAKLLDQNGRFVPDANNRIDFEIIGGKILGLGNGDPSCHDPDQFAPGVQPWRSAFNGLAQVIIKAEKGKELVLKAKAEGLKEFELKIPVH